MKPILVFLLATVTFVGATGTVAAAENPSGATGPPWPGDETTTENDTTSVSPGQQLAGAVGAQGASVQGELGNRTLAERLANATTDAERAEVVADEVELLETYLDALEGVRENVTEAWENDEISEGQYRASLSTFVIRARTVESRANQTARAAEALPSEVRETHDVDVTHVRSLAERAHELYQFEGEIAQEVTNETLATQRTGSRLPKGGDTDDPRR